MPAVISQAVQSWTDVYSHTAFLRTLVAFAHVAGLVTGGGAAIAADRATLKATRRGQVVGRDQLDAIHNTHRVVIAEEGPMRGSVGAWLAWVIMEDCFDDLDAPIARVAGPNSPIPFSPPLEAFATPGAADLVDAVRRVVK